MPLSCVEISGNVSFLVDVQSEIEKYTWRNSHHYKSFRTRDIFILGIRCERTERN